MRRAMNAVPSCRPVPAPSLNIPGVLSVVFVFVLLAVAPAAFADGGAGGADNDQPAAGQPGGIGGAGYTGQAGSNGVDNTITLGSGGGGGGAGGGAGGNGGGDGSGGAGGAGGAGGVSGSPNGGAGANGTVGNDGGGGGGGGYNGNGSGTAAPIGTLIGGNGGDGGDSASYGGGGGGGAGGYGAIVTGTGFGVVSSNIDTIGGNGGNGGNTVIAGGGNGGDGGAGIQFTASGATFSNPGTIVGGNGGNGGANNTGGLTQGGAGGNGGNGGNGVQFTASATFYNGGTILGGMGGIGGYDSANDAFAPDGYGGVGIEGANLSITNNGIISGGLDGDGVTRMQAIDFTGGVNSLTLDPGSTIVGQVTAASASINNALILGGSGSGIFDVAGFNTQYKGFGVFIKTGSSVWTLTGQTGESVSWTISQGTLNVSSDGALGGGAAVLTLDGGTLQWGANFNSMRDISFTANGGTFDTNGNTGTLYGAISGPGDLVKIGAGTLILDGVDTYSGGDTAVSGGTLEIGDAADPGASIAGSVLVNSGGTLSGHGTVLGDVDNPFGGTVAPGGSVGTLSVGGNYTQASISTLQIEVSPSGASKLAVGGTATLDGTLALVYEPGVYTGRSYTLLSAAGGISGKFSSVGGEAPSRFDQSVSYSADDVDLSLEQVVAPGNDTVFAALADQAVLDAQASETTVLGRLDDLALGIGGSGADVRTALAGPAAGSDGPWPVLPEAVTHMGGWFRAQGDFDTVQGAGGVPGFDAQGGGFTVGLDRPLGDDFVGGISAGDSHTNLSVADGESGSLDTPRLDLYASGALDRFRVDGTVGYAYDSIAAQRAIPSVGQTAASSHSGQEADGALQVDTALEVHGVTVLPKIGIDATDLSEAGFAESGAPGFDLAVAGKSSAVLQPFIGASAAKSYTTASGLTFIPQADLVWSHAVLNPDATSAVSVGGGSFTVDGLALARDEVSIGGGVSAKMTDRLALYADYHAVLPTGDLLEQTVSLGLCWRFGGSPGAR